VILDRVDGNWRAARGKLRKQWGMLTDDAYELDGVQSVASQNDPARHEKAKPKAEGRAEVIAR